MLLNIVMGTVQKRSDKHAPLNVPLEYNFSVNVRCLDD